MLWFDLKPNLNLDRTYKSNHTRTRTCSSLFMTHSCLATLRESHCGLRFLVSRDQLFYIALDPRRICKLRVDGDLGFHCIHGKTISNFQYKIIFSKYNFEFIIIKILLSQIKTKKLFVLPSEGSFYSKSSIYFFL